MNKRQGSSFFEKFQVQTIKKDLIRRLTGVQKCAVDFTAIINKVFNRFGKGKKGMTAPCLFLKAKV